MRRLIIEEPVSRAAIWSRRFAWMGIAVTVIALFLTRGGRVEQEAGLAAILAGLGFGALALLLALLAFARIWTEGRRGLGSAVGGFVLAVLLLALPAYLAASAFLAPQVRDIGTESASPGLHPGVAPLYLDIPPAEAFEIALQAADARGLAIVSTSPPAAGPESFVGRIEARTQTLIMRLPIAVSIRVTPVGDGVRIDIRAVASQGNHDLGGNLSVARNYLEEVDFLVGLR